MSTYEPPEHLTDDQLNRLLDMVLEEETSGEHVQHKLGEQDYVRRDAGGLVSPDDSAFFDTVKDWGEESEPVEGQRGMTGRQMLFVWIVSFLILAIIVGVPVIFRW